MRTRFCWLESVQTYYGMWFGKIRNKKIEWSFHYSDGTIETVTRYERLV